MKKVGVYVEGVGVLWRGRKGWVQAGSPNQKSLAIICKMGLIMPAFVGCCENQMS